ADVMMAFDHLRGIALDRHALNHIRIKGALCEKFVATMSPFGRTRRGDFTFSVSPIFLEQFLGTVLKHLDKFVSDQLALRFRVGHSLDKCKKTTPAVQLLQTTKKFLPKNPPHAFSPSRAQPPFINKTARELTPIRLGQERSGDRKINTATQAENDLLIAD